MSDVLQQKKEPQLLRILLILAIVGQLSGVLGDCRLIAQTRSPAAADTAPPLVASLLGDFQSLNPRLRSVRILGLLASPVGGDTARYVVLAIATGEGSSFTDPRNARELYGVFAVDKLLRTARRLGEFPSPRLGDYAAWLLEARGDSVIVCGRGEMYGDGPDRWAFPFDPENFGRLPLHEKQGNEDPGDGSPVPKTCPHLEQ